MIEEVPMEKLKIHENRIREVIGDLSELMKSMSEVRLLNPLTIDDNYYVLEGTRRYYSAKNLGWSKITCDRRIGLSEYQKITIEIDENLRRKNLNPAEEAKALALKKRAFLKIHPEYKRGGDRKSDKYKREKKNQTEIASVRFAKVQAQKFDTTEKTIRTKTKIGEYILDEKLEKKIIDQYSKRKLSQRKVLEEIKAIEQDSHNNQESSESTAPETQKLQKIETVKPEKTKTRVEPVRKPEIIVELDEDEAEHCKDCKDSLQLTCPSCKNTIISCQYYKNPYLRRFDSKACENYGKRL